MKHDRPASIRGGCAGWALGSKVASSFPGEGSHLERYARIFRCVEINSSFYRSHQQKTYLRWAQSVPETFRFSVKMPRTITHDLRLQKCDDVVRAFIDEVSALGDKLGCILVQLPPSLELDAKGATRFFSLLRKATSVPVACEPRHASWFTQQGARVLGSAGVARVWADPSPVGSVEAGEPGGMLYLRLHGSPQVYYSSYDSAFIDSIALRIRQAGEQGRDVWCIFDNTARGEALPNALCLMERIE